RSLSYSPLFQVMMVMQNAPMETINLSGLNLSYFTPGHNTSKFDLNLTLYETENVILAWLEYNGDLFYKETVLKILENYQALMKGAIADPEESINNLPIMTDEETRQILYDWNATSVTFGDDYFVHEIFERQAEAIPDRIAVVFEDEAITYRTLNLAANRLAHFL